MMVLAAILIFMAILASLAVSFFFSGAETAVISCSQYQLRHRMEQGDTTVEKTLAMLAQPARLISTVLIGTNLGNVFAVLFFKLLLDLLWTQSHNRVLGIMSWDELICLVVLTPVIVVFAEILPKALFRAKADAWIHRLRPVLVAMRTLCAPINAFLEVLVRGVLLPFGPREGTPMGRLTRSDLIMMLHSPVRNGGSEAEFDEGHGGMATKTSSEAPAEAVSDQVTSIREPDETRVIQNIIELENRQAREIMQPLVELEAVHLGHTTLDAFREQARRSGYSRFPAYRDRIVNLIGYIDVFDVIRDTTDKKNLEDFLRPAHFIPETKRVDDLLQEFLLLRVNNAIVVDEYGGCSGWVTREDVIEEIVGELEDELDSPTVLISEQDDGSFLIEGRNDIEDAGEVLGVQFEDTDCDTFGGLIMKHMGRIPRVGAEITLRGWRMEIVEMDEMRVAMVRVRPIR